MHLCDVTFPSGEVTLAGALGLPDGAGPCPGVVLVGGSGPSDRNNDTLFPPVREHLVDAGLAVLSYDKRGVGESTGCWQDATMDDLAADATVAVATLRDRPEVSAAAVGLFGHSEGGWVVLRAAAGRDDLPYVVTNAGPGMTPAQQDRFALATVLRADGAAEADVDSCLGLFDRVAEAGRRDVAFAEVRALLEAAPAYRLIAKYVDELDAPTWEFTKRKQDHDPVPDLASLRCPLLALFGAADSLVPVADSITAFAAAACQPARPTRATLTVHVFPGADHRVRIDDGTDFAPGYLPTLAGWIRTHSTL